MSSPTTAVAYIEGRLVILLTLETGGRQLTTWMPGDPELEVRDLNYELVGSAVVLCTFPECQ